jgi:hypothetical protein
MTARRPILFSLAIITATGAALCTVVLSVWYLSVRFDRLDALWQMPVLLCFPAGLFAALATAFTYSGYRGWFRRVLLISAAELLVCGAIWFAVRNYWVIGR